MMIIQYHESVQIRLDLGASYIETEGIFLGGHRDVLVIALVSEHEAVLWMGHHRVVVVVIGKDLPGSPVVKDNIGLLGPQHFPLLKDSPPVDCVWSFEATVAQTCLIVYVARFGEPASTAYLQEYNGLRGTDLT